MLSQTLIKHWQKIILITLLLVTLVLFLSLVPTLEYRSQTKLLIVQKHSFNLDSYTAVRSSERIAQILSQVVYTDSFMRQVLRIVPEDSSPLFGADERKARKTWENKISIHVVPSTSILEVSAYDENRLQAEKLVSGISYILINRGANYHGGENIVIKQIDSPLNSRFPVKPNIPLNLALSFLLGLFFSVGLCYYQEQKNQSESFPLPIPKKTYPDIEIDDLDEIHISKEKVPQENFN
ncbi:hypothetical protein HQ544_05250 [Candidatus Falkowbacteria bacterium]|nr:hypothetical protein [Candidatus Falkowbacteria bacterium]